MGLFDTLKKLILAGPGRTCEQLADWLQLDLDALVNLKPVYNEFTIPKRSGGTRTIAAPAPELKKIQKTILRRLLRPLKCHPHATGFERGHSIVTNAKPHVGAGVLIRMDIRNFFNATSAKRVRKFFSGLGWNRPAAKLLTKLCTHRNGLPQGAPTSPRLSNLLNSALDARLAGLARVCYKAAYSRYADDITFSLDNDDHDAIRSLIRTTKLILSDYGYKIHHNKKLFIRRAHQQQKVTGLVVNQRVALPRST
ncbi:MAG: reverse transcriptase family protein, partial [Planctomycetota bacterium]